VLHRKVQYFHGETRRNYLILFFTSKELLHEIVLVDDYVIYNSIEEYILKEYFQIINHMNLFLNQMKNNCKHSKAK